MNCPANPEGIGPMLRKFKNPFSPNTTKVSPSRRRAIKTTIFILLSFPKTGFVRFSSSEDTDYTHIFDDHSRVNRAHPAQLVIFNCLTDFTFRVHYKRPVACDGFVQWHSGDKQYLKRSVRGWILDFYFVAILREQNHLAVSGAFALCPKQTLSFHDVSEGVVSGRHLLRGRAAGLDSVMQVDDWCARFNDSSLTHRFAGDYAHHHQAVGRSRFRDL